MGLRPEYRVLDNSEQHLLLHQEFNAFIGPDWDILSGRGWRDGVHTVAGAARYFDRICDETIDVDVIAGSGRPFIAALGRCRELLLVRNAVNLARLRVWAELVMRGGGGASRAGETVRHLLVDEFQDTSRVQLLILGWLAGVHGNIAVVGVPGQLIVPDPVASAVDVTQVLAFGSSCNQRRFASVFLFR